MLATFLTVLTTTTTTSTRRSTFCYGFVVSFLRRYMSVSNTRVQKTMQLNNSKRPRNEESSPNSKEEYVNNNIMMKRSQYERKMGRIISACSTCHGEGKIRGPLSKKARALKMERRLNSNDPRPMIPCRTCDGTGLISSFLPTDSTIQHEHQSNNNDKKVGEHLPISVAIVGGGIGGIALAIALQHRNIPCVVYERDTSFEERKQGYGLTMQQGARALRSLGFFNLSDENDGNDNEEEGGTNDIDNPKKFRFGIHSTRHIVHKPCGTVVGEWGMEIWGGRFEKNGRKHAKRQNAHISRQNLRKLLMEMLQPDSIRWGHQLIGYSRRVQSSFDNHYLDLTFQRRGSEHQECNELITTITTSATILVGCDGIRSVVRVKKLGEELSPLRYLGCIVILGIVRSPDSYLTDGKTVFQTADGVTRLYAMPFAHQASDDAHIASSEEDEHGQRRGLSMWQLSFPIDEIQAQELSHGPSALKTEALKRCGLWHDPIPSLLSQTSLELITGYPCYDRDVLDMTDFRTGCKAQETADSDPFVTLLGDAAHPMSPFKGKFHS